MYPALQPSRIPDHGVDVNFKGGTGVFQDPFGSLTPRLCVQQIITEGMQVHSDLSAQAQAGAD